MRGFKCGARARALQDEVAVLAAGGVRRGGRAGGPRRASTPATCCSSTRPGASRCRWCSSSSAALAVVLRRSSCSFRLLSHALALPAYGARVARAAPARARACRARHGAAGLLRGPLRARREGSGRCVRTAGRRPASRRCSPRAPRTRCATSSGATAGSSAPTASGDALQAARLVSRAELALEERDFARGARCAAQPARRRPEARCHHAHAAARRARRRRTGTRCCASRRSSPSATRSRPRSPRNTRSRPR